MHDTRSNTLNKTASSSVILTLQIGSFSPPLKGVPGESVERR